MKKKIHFQDYIYPMDLVLSRKIMNLPVIKQVMDIIFEEKLDAINYYLYNSSCIRLPNSHPATKAFYDGSRFFNSESTPDQVYVVRSYDFDVKVIGYTDPIVLVSSRLIEENNSFLLKERVAVAAAAIAAEHHKIDFILWVYDNFSSLIRLPILNTALTGVINEWQRCRQYTLDRAFFLYTGNYPLAKKNILYGAIPYHILENFNFGDNDTYSTQVSEFYCKDNVIDMTTSVLSVLQCEIWFPARYAELQKFYLGGENHGLDM